MGIGFKIKLTFMRKIARPQYNRIIKRENAIADQENIIKYDSNSPVRFDIPLEAIKYIENGGEITFFKRKAMPIVFGSIRGIFKGLKGLKKNPAFPKSIIAHDALQKMEDFCTSLGIGMVGYTKLPNQLIFKDKGVLYKNAIVLVKEMDKFKIDSSPSVESFLEVHQTYRDLGTVTNKLAEYLRKEGYGAHPIHPLGGAVLTPPLAQAAGLGWQGRHGMLITAKFGPRVRIAAVFTSIENLPFNTVNPHSWIDSWCQKCGRCIRTCPPNAILNDKIIKTGDIKTCIDVDKCFPYFIENYGCSICIKECEFNITPYEILKSKIKK
jgi:epoxyqueuosine reductase